MNNYSQFSYDGLWRNTKIVETTSGSVTSTKQFVWSGYHRRDERDAGGNVTRRFLKWGQTVSGTSYFYAQPHLGSTSEMTDGSGVVQAQYSYDPFGRVIKLQGTLSADFQYAGYYEHEPSRLNLTVFRAYNPTLGRWISRDPYADSLPLYSYSSNIPTQLTDFHGLEPGLYWPPNIPQNPSYPGVGEAVWQGLVNYGDMVQSGIDSVFQINKAIHRLKLMKLHVWPERFGGCPIPPGWPGNTNTPPPNPGPSPLPPAGPGNPPWQQTTPQMPNPNPGTEQA